MSVVVELSSLADKAAASLARLRDAAIQEPARALRESCENVERAWSGSNIGYHARVYWRGLQPKPPAAQFSSEWGLMDVWPTHEAEALWEIMDEQNVIDYIIRRAGVNADELEGKLAPLREAFEDLKEEAISILSTQLTVEPDTLLQKKLDKIKELDTPVSMKLALQLLPRGTIWSRDSLALSQGLKIAPHQQLAALPMSAVALETAIDGLEKASRQSARHIQRRDQMQRRPPMTPGTTVFIGHGGSLVWRELKDFLSERLGLSVDEFNSVPVAGVATVERLSEMLGAAVFAFLVMTAEDERSDGMINARLNVIHEVGLFQGRLGFKKAIVLLEEGCEEFSNIHGLG